MITNSKADGAGRRKRGTVAESRPTPLDALTGADLRTLRLSDDDIAQFELLRHQVKLSRNDLRGLEVEDVSAMDDARYDRLTAAQDRMTTDAAAMVHFLAPRIMRLRDGEAKRKWRSFVTKLRKNSKAA